MIKLIWGLWAGSSPMTGTLVRRKFGETEGDQMCALTEKQPGDDRGRRQPSSVICQTL